MVDVAEAHPPSNRKGVYAMKPSKRSIGIVGVLAAGVLLSPLAAAQDSSAPSDNRAAQAWRDLQQRVGNRDVLSQSCYDHGLPSARL